ncbi:MAG: shikimate dehydrogenase [Actinomycetota bacterium]|nr:shikimate dehydrogenase [Actinomycetota bacterium]
MPSGTTQLLGIIGHPIGHTLSPHMHNAAFAHDGADYVYVAMDVWPNRLPAAVEGLRALGFVGFNVTMPHKEAILPLLDELDETARLAGAVNTVVAVEEGKLRGLNTDGSGFVEACREVGVSVFGENVLILGAGGAAAAIAAASLGEGASRLYIANRTEGRAQELRARLSRVAHGTKILVRPFGEVGEVAAEARIVVNATYLGMRDEDPLPLPAGALSQDKVVCDAVYLLRKETPIIRRAREVGAQAVSGGRMLLYQGVQAQRIWTGREPNIEMMNKALI